MYSVYVDSASSSTTFNGSSSEFVGHNLFFQQGGLNCQQSHTIVFTNGGNTFFDLDYFVVTSISGASPYVLVRLDDLLMIQIPRLGSATAVSSPTQTLDSTGLPTGSATSSSSHSSNTPIIAGVVAGVVLVAILAALFYWFWTRRERRHERELEAARDNVLGDQNRYVKIKAMS